MNKYIRFISGLNNYLCSRMSPDEAIEAAKKQLHERMSGREENFLTFVKKGIYEYQKSPYRILLDASKISYSDVDCWVKKNGIESTLQLLYEEGVYFTVDEFKGKTNVNRNNVTVKYSESDFDNPFISSVYEVRSGATRSAGTRVRIDFDYLSKRAMYDAYLLSMHNLLTVPIANWFPLFPGAPGINSSLRFAKIGNPPKRWFSQVKKAQIHVNWEKVWGTKLIFLIARLYGVPFASPEYVDLNSAYKIAQWAEQMCKEYSSCVIYTFATSAVRVCIAAQESNLKIKGTHFMVTGETLTTSKKKEIEYAGAKTIPVYGISEAGVIAAGCNSDICNVESDHCHVYKDTTAIINHNYQVPFSDTNVNSYLFTNLMFESPKLLLNVGMGDYGKIYDRETDCGFGKIGFSTHLSNIKSYEKLTGEGVTFVDSDFVKIIENELPARYGGCSTDYQLVEEEDEKGFNRLHLIISPRLGSLDEEMVACTFMDLLKKSENSPESWAQSGTVMWNQARTLRVKRDFPMPTRSGKILPFHINN